MKTCSVPNLIFYVEVSIYQHCLKLRKQFTQNYHFGVRIVSPVTDDIQALYCAVVHHGSHISGCSSIILHVLDKTILISFYFNRISL